MVFVDKFQRILSEDKLDDKNIRYKTRVIEKDKTVELFKISLFNEYGFLNIGY